MRTEHNSVSASWKTPVFHRKWIVRCIAHRIQWIFFALKVRIRYEKHLTQFMVEVLVILKNPLESIDSLNSIFPASVECDTFEWK